MFGRRHAPLYTIALTVLLRLRSWAYSQCGGCRSFDFGIGVVMRVRGNTLDETKNIDLVIMEHAQGTDHIEGLSPRVRREYRCTVDR